MARIQAADYDTKRAAITAHAAHLFAARGFGGASIADLAAAGGFSKSLIYHYYAAKEDILYDVMRSHIDALVAVKDRVANEGGSPETRLRRLAHDLLDHYVGASDSQKVLLYELNQLTPAQRSDIVAKQRDIVDFTQSLFAALDRRASNHGELRVKVMLFFGMLNWTHNWFRPDGAIGRDRIADQAVNAMLGDLGRRGDSRLA